MRSIKFLHTIAVSVTLAVLVLAICAPVTLAARDITLDPEEVEIGDWIEIDGEGFPPSDFTSGSEEYSWVDIYFSSQEGDTLDRIDDEITAYELVKTLLVNEDGEFSTGFDIPANLTDGNEAEDVHRGTYYVYVTFANEDSIKAAVELTVISAEIDLEPDEVTVGTELEIVGADFTGRETITIEYDDEDVEIASGDEKTDRDGDFVCAIIIPESTFGKHTITVTDESGSKAEADLTVEPEITANPTEGAGGLTVSIKGAGFGARSDVTITFDDIEAVTTETNKYGSFKAAFAVPAKSAGTYKIEAKDADKNKDRADFTVAAGSIGLSHKTGNIGSENCHKRQWV